MDNYDVVSFKSTNLYAKKIGAIQYKFIFTEVNEDRTTIPNPEVFESIRNSNSTRLYWARNSNGDRLTDINKTYKVEVIGIFLSGQSAVNEYCYVNTPSTSNITIIQNDFLEDKISESILTIQEMNTFNQLKIYPNPINGDVINLEFYNESLKNDLNINILDINGRKIESRKIYSESGLNKKEIILKNQLSKGIYFVQIKNGSFISTKKLQVL